jgi:hypothetical protein
LPNSLFQLIQKTYSEEATSEKPRESETPSGSVLACSSKFPSNYSEFWEINLHHLKCLYERKCAISSVTLSQLNFLWRIIFQIFPNKTDAGAGIISLSDVPQMLFPKLLENFVTSGIINMI